ncbi:hypothetical protein CYY_004007 [Polysphondylium violaceum]|uniref:tRNA/rRNA methyltransferase SpoU type domain-containing protein n=1 Tax=Polysphondylium violaceum TaxID=133409 RepID=A0A8J4PVA5_9MYCE|nr:hypothetical protein CYY_004007 [Polysphondylium violaceum]
MINAQYINGVIKRCHLNNIFNHSSIHSNSSSKCMTNAIYSKSINHRYFCSTTTTTAGVKVTNTNLIDTQEEIHCTDPACSTIFRVPSKLRGKYGYCPACSNKTYFKKHSSNYKLLLTKKREQYQNELNDQMKLKNTIDLDKNPPKGLNVLLEDCRSLPNVGSIFRTSDGAGFSHIYLTGITGTPPKPEISKTALGAEDMVPWSFTYDSLDCIKQLKSKNVLIIGIEQTPTSCSIFNSIEKIKQLVEQQEREQRPICVVMGNEVAGLADNIIKECDLICELPMNGHKRSLNVSIAFGIVSYILSFHFPKLVLDKSLTRPTHVSTQLFEE